MKRKIIKLADCDPDFTGHFKSKEHAQPEHQTLSKELYDLLYLMFAENHRSLLIILQGIDTSGKDGVVRHLFASANPQGMRVYSFKKPTEEELRHDFIWRCHKCTPETGMSSIFNRSYYEEVTTVRVHPKLLEQQRLPAEVLKQKKFFERRYQRINEFEKLLSDHGTLVKKFFLHISKHEQKRRLEERLKDHTRNWKFSPADIQERGFWNEHQKAAQQMLGATDTEHSPWHVIPANNKWYRDHQITKILVDELKKMKMKFPAIKAAKKIK